MARESNCDYAAVLAMLLLEVVRLPSHDRPKRLTCRWIAIDAVWVSPTPSAVALTTVFKVGLLFWAATRHSMLTEA